MKPYLSVVIPAYNEEYNLRTGVLDSVYDFLLKQKYTWEILFVDDGSTDNTVSLAEAFAKNHTGFKVLKEPHRGKAGTVVAGILKAAGEIVLFTDTDQATPIDQVDKILPRFEHGYDIVIGSRRGRPGAPLIRKFIALGFSVLRFLILRLPYRDTQCGFKAFKSESAQKIFEQLKIFDENRIDTGASVTAGFDLEVLYIARKLKLKVAEVNVDWHDKGERGDSAVDPIRDSLNGLKDLIQVRLNSLQGKYRV